MADSEVTTKGEQVVEEQEETLESLSDDINRLAKVQADLLSHVHKITSLIHAKEGKRFGLFLKRYYHWVFLVLIVFFAICFTRRMDENDNKSVALVVNDPPCYTEHNRFCTTIEAVHETLTYCYSVLRPC